MVSRKNQFSRFNLNNLNWFMLQRIKSVILFVAAVPKLFADCSYFILLFFFFALEYAQHTDATLNCLNFKMGTII